MADKSAALLSIMQIRRFCLDTFAVIFGYFVFIMLVNTLAKNYIKFSKKFFTLMESGSYKFYFLFGTPVALTEDKSHINRKIKTYKKISG